MDYKTPKEIFLEDTLEEFTDEEIDAIIAAQEEITEEEINKELDELKKEFEEK